MAISFKKSTIRSTQSLKKRCKPFTIGFCFPNPTTQATQKKASAILTEAFFVFEKNYFLRLKRIIAAARNPKIKAIDDGSGTVVKVTVSVLPFQSKFARAFFRLVAVK